MTIARSPGHTSSEHASSAWQARLPGTAGIVYVVAWVVGLAAWPANLALNATAGQVAAAHRAHPAESTVQYLLVEGIAGLLLGIVLAYVLRANRDRVTWQTAGPALLIVVAVITSLTECVLALLVTAAATGGHVATAGSLFEVVNRLDGVKMFALAGVTSWLAATRPALPRWLRRVTVVVALALIASGLAYVTLTNAFGWTAFVSLPLLLLWVAGAGIALSVAAGRRTARP